MSGIKYEKAEAAAAGYGRQQGRQAVVEWQTRGRWSSGGQHTHTHTSIAYICMYVLYVRNKVIL